MGLCLHTPQGSCPVGDPGSWQHLACVGRLPWGCPHSRPVHHVVGVRSKDHPLPPAWLGLARSSPVSVHLDVLVRGAVARTGEWDLRPLMRHWEINTQIFHQRIPTASPEGGDASSLLMYMCVFKKLLPGTAVAGTAEFVDPLKPQRHRQDLCNPADSRGSCQQLSSLVQLLCFYSLRVKVSVALPIMPLLSRSFPLLRTTELSPSSVVFTDFLASAGSNWELPCW